MRGRRKAVVTAPAAGSDRKAPPLPLGMSTAAAAKWLAIVPQIAELCDLRDTDADALRQYCEAAALWQRATRELESADLIIEAPNGAQQVNPLLKIVSQAESLMLKLSERFGLDPASRKRLQIAAQTAANPFVDFLKSGRTRKPAPVEG